MPLEACCGPRHSGATPAETAEALMRSRYSAYVLGLGDYLVQTCTRAAGPTEASELGAWGRSVGWLGLSVLECAGGGPADAQGEVHFVARYVERGAVVQLEERSRFVRADARWRYVSGDASSSAQRVPRNEPCPCGSGKKVKQCHS